MTKAEAAKIAAVIAAAFPNARLTPEAMGIYERMLIDLEYPAVNAAVERLLATSRFPPTIAEVRETVLSLTTGEQKQGGEAWGEVLRAIGRYGIYRSPGHDFFFDDPVTAQCVSALSWRELCNSENQQADRARFIELYEQLSVRHRKLQLSEGLPAMQRFRELEAKRIERRPSTLGEAMKRALELADESRDDDGDSGGMLIRLTPHE